MSWFDFVLGMTYVGPPVGGVVVGVEVALEVGGMSAVMLACWFWCDGWYTPAAVDAKVGVGVVVVSMSMSTSSSSSSASASSYPSRIFFLIVADVDADGSDTSDTSDTSGAAVPDDDPAASVLGAVVVSPLALVGDDIGTSSLFGGSEVSFLLPTASDIVLD